MERSRLNLIEKIEVLNYGTENLKKDCRDIASHFQIGKTAVASI